MIGSVTHSSAAVQLQVVELHQVHVVVVHVVVTVVVLQTALPHEPATELLTPVGSSAYLSIVPTFGRSQAQVVVGEETSAGRPTAFVVLHLTQTLLDPNDEPLTWLTH